jgi:hypothetical protein
VRRFARTARPGSEFDYRPRRSTDGGASAAVQGFMDGIKGSNIQRIVATADGDWLRDTGQQQADAIRPACARTARSRQPVAGTGRRRETARRERRKAGGLDGQRER